MAAPGPRLDDRWIADAMAKLRLSTAVAGLENEFDVACCAVSRYDVELALGRTLSQREWHQIRESLRDQRSEGVTHVVRGLVSDTDGGKA